MSPRKRQSFAFFRHTLMSSSSLCGSNDRSSGILLMASDKRISVPSVGLDTWYTSSPSLTSFFLWRMAPATFCSIVSISVVFVVPKRDSNPHLPGHLPSPGRSSVKPVGLPRFHPRRGQCYDCAVYSLQISLSVPFGTTPLTVRMSRSPWSSSQPLLTAMLHFPNWMPIAALSSGISLIA